MTVPLQGPHTLRDRSKAGFGEIPDWGHAGRFLDCTVHAIRRTLMQHGSSCSGSAREMMVRLTLGGGFAPMRSSILCRSACSRKGESRRGDNASLACRARNDRKIYRIRA